MGSRFAIPKNFAKGLDFFYINPPAKNVMLKNAHFTYPGEQMTAREKRVVLETIGVKLTRCKEGYKAFGFPPSATYHTVHGTLEEIWRAAYRCGLMGEVS